MEYLHIGKCSSVILIHTHFRSRACILKLINMKHTCTLVLHFVWCVCINKIATNCATSFTITDHPFDYFLPFFPHLLFTVTYSPWPSIHIACPLNFVSWPFTLLYLHYLLKIFILLINPWHLNFLTMHHHIPLSPLTFHLVTPNPQCNTSRLATNNGHFMTAVLGISDPIHRQKICLKAMDVVLFGPPKRKLTTRNQARQWYDKHDLLTPVLCCVSLPLFPTLFSFLFCYFIILFSFAFYVLFFLMNVCASAWYFFFFFTFSTFFATSAWTSLSCVLVGMHVLPNGFTFFILHGSFWAPLCYLLSFINGFTFFPFFTISIAPPLSEKLTSSDLFLYQIWVVLAFFSIASPFCYHLLALVWFFLPFSWSLVCPFPY